MARALFIIAFLAMTVFGCSEEDNPYWWQGGLRDAGRVLPETLDVFASRDTTVEVETSTGGSNTLLVGRYEGIEAASFLKFTSLPDSADGITSARLSLLVRGGYGDAVRVQILEVTSGTDWTEEDIRYGNRPGVGEILDTSIPLQWAEAETILHSEVLEVPRRILQGWIEGDGNGGVMLSVPEGENGMLQILSSEATFRDTSGTQVVNPLLAVFQDDAVLSTHGPSQDAYVQNRFDGTAWGVDPAWLGVGGGRTRRTLIGFDLSALGDSLGSEPTFSIAGASLHVTPLDEAPDGLPYADSVRVSLFALGPVPAWGEDGEVSDSLSLSLSVSGQDDLTAGNEASFRFTALVKEWVNGTRENAGVVLISSGETLGLEGIRFAARGTEGQPFLRLVVTRPAPVRLGVDR
jgi:hypothetical protein